MSAPLATVPIMPSHLHEVLVALFRERRHLAADVLGIVLGIELPEYTDVQVTAGDLTDVKPTEFRADVPWRGL